jgi:hypothetical protein
MNGGLNDENKDKSEWREIDAASEKPSFFS